MAKCEFEKDEVPQSDHQEWPSEDGSQKGSSDHGLANTKKEEGLGFGAGTGKPAVFLKWVSQVRVQ